MRSEPGSGQLVSSDAPRVRLRPIPGQFGDRVRPTPRARGCRAGYTTRPDRGLLPENLLADLIEPSLHAAAGARPIGLAHMRGRLPKLHAVGDGLVEGVLAGARAGVWPDPAEVCELGGTGLIGPVDPLALDWPFRDCAVGRASQWTTAPCVLDVDASVRTPVDVPGSRGRRWCRAWCRRVLPRCPD